MLRVVVEVALRASLSLLLVGRVKRARHEYDLRVTEGARQERQEPSFLASSMFARARACTSLTKSKERERLFVVYKEIDIEWTSAGARN